ncbi:hypothetical protein Ocin01_18678 [Orchesella cincta]|uniref:Uncharacterized protein n=1 Tax=Orchesella cincta TaxID=48709 RepID=A0A1D2M4V7_ORCCI|nr:hypothetical protein Ocin01_18678 [Orchesella cincta]
MKSLFFPIAIFVTAFISSIQCLDLESAKEQPCFKIKKTVPLITDDWVQPEPKAIYYPLMSRLDLYRNAIDLLQKDPAEISESELYYDACIVWKCNNETYFSEGFGGRTREYTADPEDDKMEVYTMRPLKGKGYGGKAFTTYSDNETFFFTAVCGDDGQMAWNVASLTPTLPRESVKIIHEHALSLGFKKEFFTELRYDRCHFQNDI